MSARPRKGAPALDPGGLDPAGLGAGDVGAMASHELAAPGALRRPSWVAPAGVALGWVAFVAVVTNQALVAAILDSLFPGSRSAVLPDPTLAQLTAQHLTIVLVSSGLTILVGVPLGIWVTRRSGADFRAIVSAGVDFGQVFPPIAVLALMLPILGLGIWPAIVALFLYGLFPVVSSTVAGLDNVPAPTVDAATGVGMSHGQVLRRVELPLSAAVIMAGIRTSVIINVGTATIAAATGAGGLGLPIFTGISTQNLGYIVEGAVTVSVLALLLDATLSLVERWVTPRGLAE
jgi:osmoprotectant transport system permease protein